MMQSCVLTTLRLVRRKHYLSLPGDLPSDGGQVRVGAHGKSILVCNAATRLMRPDCFMYKC